MKKLTQNEKRIKIAEACGWRRSEWKYGMYEWNNPQGFNTPPNKFPDYFSDLNAMREAEKLITNRHLWMFCLAEVVGIDVHWNGRSSCTAWSIEECDKIQNATAEQRAEAFGKTLNLW